MDKPETIYDIRWEGPFDYGRAVKTMKSHHVLYQIYGHQQYLALYRNDGKGQIRTAFAGSKLQILLWRRLLEVLGRCNGQFAVSQVKAMGSRLESCMAI
jgi:hypothetical protein